MSTTQAANAHPDYSDERIKQLWCAVLELAIRDAKSPKPKFRKRDWKRMARARANPTTAEEVEEGFRKAHKNAVADWQSNCAYIGSRSFREVCWLCGLDPEAVEWRVRRQMAEPE